MEKKVLFLDSVHPILEKNLTQDGFVCIHNYDCDATALAGMIDSFVGLVLRSRLTLDADILKNGRNLKFIARSGSGMENMDVDFANSMGIACFNSPEGNRDAVGEHAVAMLLNLLNHVVIGNTEVKLGLWNREKNRGKELGCMTIGLIGFGNTGSAFAEKLSGFGCSIYAHDIDESKTADGQVILCDLKTIQEKADVLSLHIPYNSQNHHLANAHFFNSFQNPIYVLNTSRGDVLNTNDLILGIKNGNILGAGLDVLEYESASFDMKADREESNFKFLQTDPRVLLTPHVAGWTQESYIKLSEVLYTKLKSHFEHWPALA